MGLNCNESLKRIDMLAFFLDQQNLARILDLNLSVIINSALSKSVSPTFPKDSSQNSLK